MSHWEMPEPCLRLAHGTGEYASVQLGDGTGYVPRKDYRGLQLVIGELRGLVAALLRFHGPDMGCNIECPAMRLCEGKSRCEFLDWAEREARKLGVEVDE